jgi:glutamate carboxypeptidase
MASSSDDQNLMDWLDQQQQPMLDLLEQIVNIDSNSYDPEGVDAVGDAIKAHLEARGIETEIVPRPNASFCLVAKVKVRDQADNAKPILLMGHRDTVFPKGEAGRRPFKVEAGKAYGPGVADMKCGLVMNCFVAEAFHRFGGNAHPVQALFTSDEEIGSPSSRPVIEGLARGASYVFNSEPGRPSGNIVRGRKGAWFSAINVKGIAAHSGAAHQHGASAIRALCRKIEALEQLTDYDTGITANVGLIEGGQSMNTVPPSARCSIDIRYGTKADLPGIESAVKDIVERVDVERTTAELEPPTVFLPFELTSANQALFERYQQASADLGLTVEGDYSGGAADSGFTSALGIPTICAVGPVGERGHQEDEAVYIESLVPRAKAVAATILGLAND